MKKNKNLKINWINASVLLVGLISLCIIVHDIFMLTIYNWITNSNYGWTGFGLITFIIALIMLEGSIDCISHEIKNHNN